MAAKDEEQENIMGSDENPFASLLGDDFDSDAHLPTPYTPPAASQETLDLIADFEGRIEQIHEGEFPDWATFFSDALKLDTDYFSIFGESTALSDELMSVYELSDVEALYSDRAFLKEITALLPEDVHFACFLINSEFEPDLSSDVLTGFLDAITQDEFPSFCDGCSGNHWWGNPLAYIAIGENTSWHDLERIYELALVTVSDTTQDIILCTLAQNVNTPVKILEILAQQDRDSVRAKDEQCPFYDEDNNDSSNIAYWAKRRLAEKS